MIWRRCSVIAPQRTGEIGFGCREKPAGTNPLTIEHNPYEIPDLANPLDRYIKMAFVCFAITGLIVVGSLHFFYRILPPLAMLFGMFFGAWLQEHTGGYVHYRQIPRIILNAICTLFR